MVNAQEFVTYKEAKDPVKVSERSKVAWKEAKKMEAQWVSADSLYSRSEVPAKSGVTVRVLEGWKGERVSTQLLLWSGKGVDGIKCKVKDFVSTDAKMPADIAKARFVRYTIADQGGYDCRCDRGPKHKAFLAPDMIDTLNVFNMEPHSVRPVWVTVDIPSDAKPGRYSSAIVVTAKGVGKTILPLCTNEGSGMGGSEKGIKKLAPGAEVRKGLPITGSNAANSGESVRRWLKANGLL